MKTQTAALLFVSTHVWLAGCAAHFASRPAELNKANDDILYKLPVREYVVNVTYELEQCLENAPLDDQKLRIKVVSVGIDSELVPSESERDWFRIDPKELDQFFSAVDPATIDLQKGMLVTAGLKSTGAVSEVLSLASSIAGSALLSDTDINCQPAALKALKNDAAAKAEIEKLAGLLKEADEAFLKAPTQDAERKLKMLEARLADAAAERTQARDAALRKTIAYRLRPTAASTVANNALQEGSRGAETSAASAVMGYSSAPLPSSTTPPKSSAPAATSTANVFKAHAHSAQLIDWFDIHVDQQLPPKLEEAFNATLKVSNQLRTGTSVSLPSDGKAFAGIYYRRPATAQILISVATSNGRPTEYRVLDGNDLIPQLGSLQRVSLKGRAFGTRNLSVSLDEAGDIKHYEITSKGMATAMLESFKQVDAALAKPAKPTELQTLTAEVDLLKKKKELIDARAALENASTPDTQN